MQSKKITIGINASFLRKPHTGIGQVTINFLRKLAEVKAKNENVKSKDYKYILYLEEKLPKNIKFPENFETRVFLPPYKRDDLIRKIWWEKFSLPKQARKDGCDFFLSLYQCPTVIKNIPHIMIVHDIIPEIFPEYRNNLQKAFYWRLTRKAIIEAEKIVAVSKNTEKDLTHLLKIEPAKISVNHISTDEIFEARVAEEKKDKVLRRYKIKPGYILAGGGYEVRKNIQAVILAYKKLIEKNKNLRFVLEMPPLVIYGRSLPPNLPLAFYPEKLIRELNLTKQVKILGETAQEDMPVIFQSASCFVYPSFYEGFGIPVLEAMKRGTPVITAKNSSLPEIGLDSVLYVRPEEIDDIEMAMQSLLTKGHLREEIKRRSLERAKNFSWEKFTEKILHIIENLK